METGLRSSLANLSCKLKIKSQATRQRNFAGRSGISRYENFGSPSLRFCPIHASEGILLAYPDGQKLPTKLDCLPTFCFYLGILDWNF